MKESAKKVTRCVKGIKAMRLLDGEGLFVGIDVHKKSFDLALWSLERGLIRTWSQPADAQVVVKHLHRYAEHIKEIVYEAGPTGFGLVRILRSAGFKAEVVAPSMVPSTPAKRSKSDRLDCRKLAEFSSKKVLRFVQVPTEREEADRQVVRLHHQLSRKIRRIKQQIKSFLLLHGIKQPNGLRSWSNQAIKELAELELDSELRFALDVLLDEFRHFKQQRQRVLEQIRKLAEAPRHEQDVALMRSVRGVGPIVAMTVRTEMFTPERFKDARDVAMYAGLAPLVSESGEKRCEGHIMKSGNPNLRMMLIEGAWQWVVWDTAARARYNRLLRNTGNPKKAIVAMARHLVVLTWKLLVENSENRRAA